MSFRSHAQNFEDVLLWRALGHVERGRYLDVGARHPRRDSVSRGFYECGWRGVHVEPSPVFAALLRDDRPDEPVIEAAVSSAVEPLIFYEIADTGLSTGVAEIADLHRAGGSAVAERVVATTSLDALLDRFAAGDLHWLRIDVEGMEADVLASWRESTVRPWIVVVAATDPLSQRDTSSAWEAALFSRAYEAVHVDGRNRYYIAREHAELRAAFATPINLFDDVVLAADHRLCVAATAEIARDAAERIASLERAAEAAQADSRAAVQAVQVELSAERRVVAELRTLIRPAPPRREARGAATLADLLMLADTAFIEAAYLTILGRPADPTGRQHYLAQLRIGMAKIDIAAELARSPEAQSAEVTLPGLDRALRRRRAERLPFVGPAILWLTRGERLSADACRLRAIENRLAALHGDGAETAPTQAHDAGIADRLRPVSMDLAETPALDADFTPRAQEILREFIAARRSTDA